MKILHSSFDNTFIPKEYKNIIKKCIIICNGPSVEYIKKFNINFNEYDIIAVNRWNNVFKKLNIPNPKYVIVGKNSIVDNVQNFKKFPNINFICIDNYNSPNCYKLYFGPKNVYGKNINFISSLWWTGTYAIQFALQLEYDEIHVFGFSCTNDNDYKDNIKRALIPQINLLRILNFFKELNENNLLNKILFYENIINHNILSYFSDYKLENKLSLV
jgi:hypothetical protein